MRPIPLAGALEKYAAEVGAADRGAMTRSGSNASRAYQFTSELRTRTMTWSSTKPSSEMVTSGTNIWTV